MPCQRTFFHTLSVFQHHVYPEIEHVVNIVLHLEDSHSNLTHTVILIEEMSTGIEATSPNRPTDGTHRQGKFD